MFSSLGSKGDSHLLENWLGLVGGPGLEGRVDEFSGLEQIVVGLDVTRVRDFVVGTY